MPNEIILIFTLIATFALLILWFRLFGKAGMTGWTVLATIAANIEVAVLIRAFGLEQTLGNVLFASTFTATDILSELYGKKEAQKAVNIGIAASLSFIILSRFWLMFTPDAADTAFPAIDAIFSGTPRIMLAGVAVYAVVQRFDVWAYHRIWKLTSASGDRNRMLWLRNNAATMTSQLLNAFLFNFAAFYGVYEMKTLVSISLSTYIVYLVISLADTPVVYLARAMYNKNRKEANEFERL